ncbi:MAG: mechanosensitive ion channel protein MscS [Sandaracinus sp.]|nr:mechanosensitive ion channel protein MscS [Sandaracinus sp.]|tara:strand:+ start:5034 stop:5942 length:909 start_codon:yes stop_codon:yes gene_type:complete
MNFGELWSTVVEKLEAWAQGAARMLPNIGLALITAIVLYALSKLVRKAVEKALSKTRMHRSARDLLVSIVHFASLVAVLMITLSILDLNKVVTSLLAGAGVVGLALGFAFQDLAANFISGVGLSVRHPFNVGDIIETNDVIGVVEQLDLRTTRLRTFDGKRVIVPNSKIYQEVLINHTDNDLKRMDLGCGVGYGDDLQKVRKVALEALNALDSRDERREAELFFTEFGDSSINFTARVWFDYNSQGDLLRCQSEAVMALKAAFDANDITIPFPIRTLDFGPNGGVKLDEVWPGAEPGARAEA